MDTLDIAFEDYHSTQDFISRMDQYIFSIRNLAVATSSAIIAYAVSENKATILLTNYFLIFCFIFLEYSWKCFQEDAIMRTYKLEDMIQNSIKGNVNAVYPYEFGLGHVIRAPSIRKILRLIFKKDRWHNLMFYLIILVANSLAYFLFSYYNK